MRRREVIALLGSVAAVQPLALRAQAGKLYRVGILWPGAPAANTSRMDAFRRGLRQLGYVEGLNLAIVAKGSEPGSVPTQLLAFADE